MEARQFLEFSGLLIGYIEARRMLSSGSLDAFWHIFRGRLQSVEQQGFLSCFRRREITRHGLGGTCRRHMRSARTYDDGRSDVVESTRCGRLRSILLANRLSTLLSLTRVVTRSHVICVSSSSYVAHVG